MVNSLPASIAKAPPARRSLLLDRARSLSKELHALFKVRHQNQAAIAHALAVMKREELFSYLGYASVFAYAWDQHRMGKSKVSELIGISSASDRLPSLRVAFDEGQLDWTKAREIAKVATPETELEWLRMAESSTAEDLRAARSGEPTPRRRALQLPDEAAALYDQLVAGIKQELGIVPDWQAVLELMKRGASGERGEAPVMRIVITECATCHEATSETHEGPVEVSQAAVDHARCDGEIHDLREEPCEVKRTIPSRIRRRVLDRDRRRCLVPGCRAMAALDVHHEDGWMSGHDPERMLTLCWSHHRRRHQGVLRIEGRAPNFRFSLLDGVVLGESPDAAGFTGKNPSERDTRSSELKPAAFSYENSSERDPRSSELKPAAFSYENSSERNPHDSESEEDSDPVRVATLALRSLGLGSREANRQIRAALGRADGQSWTALGLLKAALRAG